MVTLILSILLAQVITFDSVLRRLLAQSLLDQLRGQPSLVLHQLNCCFVSSPAKQLNDAYDNGAGVVSNLQDAYAAGSAVIMTAAHHRPKVYAVTPRLHFTCCKHVQLYVRKGLTHADFIAWACAKLSGPSFRRLSCFFGSARQHLA